MAVGSVWLTLRAEFRSGWRSWLALALLLGVMGGVVLAAAAGARRTDTAFPRLLAWSRASALQVVPYGNGVPGYYRALGRLPQVAAMSTADLMDMAVRVGGGYVPAAQFQVYASPDGRMGVSVDRVKVLAGRLFDPADPRAIMIDQKLADEEHARPGSTVRLLGVPDDQNGNPDLGARYPAVVPGVGDRGVRQPDRAGRHWREHDRPAEPGVLADGCGAPGAELGV